MSIFKKFKAIRQLDEMDCGPVCLKMIAEHWGKKTNLDHLRRQCDKGAQGVTLLGMNETAEEIGLVTSPVRISLEKLLEKAKLPCILHWRGNHYIVLHKITRSHVYIADPAIGSVKLTFEQLRAGWLGDADKGIALFLQPGPEFSTSSVDDTSDQTQSGLKLLWVQARIHKQLLGQLLLVAIFGVVLNFIYPFLAQSMIDKGVGNRDIDFVYLVLIGQTVLFLSRTVTDFIRGWIIVHVGMRLNISLISGFLRKLLSMPLAYFNSRNIGDTLTRVEDHRKIEEFLTSHSINIIFSALNLAAFSVIMLLYSYLIFLVFAIGSLLSIVWALLFMRRRRIYDYQQFEQTGKGQNHVMEIITGMHEIKLNQAETYFRMGWEAIQARLFNTKLKTLALEQVQQGGNLFFNEGKNLLISFFAAKSVIDGDITLGMLIAITYILGQLNGPIEQFIDFLHQGQDAKISLDRLSEVHSEKSESDIEHALVHEVPNGDINVDSLTFKYSRHDPHCVLNNISFTIPEQKITAIVGASGSGKTTLAKLLLKQLEPTDGRILVDRTDVKSIAPRAWRRQTASVFQDGYMFSDTVLHNIALGVGTPDLERAIMAAKTANIHDEIERLPLGYMTKVGLEGAGLSGGQSQRILLARAVYRNPSLLILDEATSALDATNEKIIQASLSEFFAGKTVVVVAHRLSTVKNADKIIVLQQGKIIEEGTHTTLINKRGEYYTLVENQLELGA